MFIHPRSRLFVHSLVLMFICSFYCSSVHVFALVIHLLTYSPICSYVQVVEYLRMNSLICSSVHFFRPFVHLFGFFSSRVNVSEHPVVFLAPPPRLPVLSSGNFLRRKSGRDCRSLKPLDAGGTFYAEVGSPDFLSLLSFFFFLFSCCLCFFLSLSFVLFFIIFLFFFTFSSRSPFLLFSFF